MAKGSRSNPGTDATDRRILEALRDDGRLSMAQLAALVGVSRANVYGRVRRLRGQGILEGFTAKVDSSKLGLGIAALIMIGIDTQVPSWDRVREKLRAFPEVEYCALTAGEFDGVALVRVSDIEALRDMVVSRLHTMPEVRSTRTIFILDEILHRPAVLPPTTGDPGG